MFGYYLTVPKVLQCRPGYAKPLPMLQTWMCDTFKWGDFEYEPHSSGCDIIFKNKEDLVQFKLFWADAFAIESVH